MANPASFSKEELAEYDCYWDQVSIEKTIKSDARNEGLAEGLMEGEARGREEGERQAKRDVALEMLREGFTDEMIVKIVKSPLRNWLRLSQYVKNLFVALPLSIPGRCLIITVDYSIEGDICAERRLLALLYFFAIYRPIYI